jgi:hypothetical protein
VLAGVVAAGIVLRRRRRPVSALGVRALPDGARLEPRGIERITRHPFFAGTALLGLGHALLASRLTGVVFFGGLALFALAGAWHQDRKLLATRGAAHAALLARTSLVPFAAIVAGRQRLVVGELPLGAIALGGVGAWLLGGPAHAAIMAHGGAYVVLAVVGGGVLAACGPTPAPSARHRRAVFGPRRGAGFAHAAVTPSSFPMRCRARRARRRGRDLAARRALMGPSLRHPRPGARPARLGDEPRDRRQRLQVRLSGTGAWAC